MRSRKMAPVCLILAIVLGTAPFVAKTMPGGVASQRPAKARRLFVDYLSEVPLAQEAALPFLRDIEAIVGRGDEQHPSCLFNKTQFLLARAQQRAAIATRALKAIDASGIFSAGIIPLRC